MAFVFEPGVRDFRWLRDSAARCLGLVWRVRRFSHDFDSSGRHLDRPPGVGVAVELLVELLVTSCEISVRRLDHVDGRLGTLIPHVERADRRLDVLGWDAFGMHMVTGLSGEFREGRLEFSQQERGVLLQNGPLAETAHVGQSNAVCTQDPCVRVYQNAWSSQVTRQRAGVLCSRATEGHQCVIGGIISLRHRDPADGTHHVRIGDLAETLGELDGRVLPPHWRVGDSLTQCLETRFHSIAIQRKGKS